MADFLLIVFLGNQNVGIDTKIVFPSGFVRKLLDIKYFFDLAHLL